MRKERIAPAGVLLPAPRRRARPRCLRPTDVARPVAGVPRCRKLFARTRPSTAYVADDENARRPQLVSPCPGGGVMSIEVPDGLLDALADRLAPRLAACLNLHSPADTSPWLTFAEAVRYTKIPAGTFRKLSADGTFVAHGGKRKVYHRQQLDEALSALTAHRRGRRPVLRRAV